MNSTLRDVNQIGSSKLRLVLRGATLIVLVGFLGAALMGVFDHPAEVSSEDGVIRVNYQGSIRSGTPVQVLVTMASPDCDHLVISLDAEYAQLFDELTVEPAPTVQHADDDGVRRWEFAQRPKWVSLAGQAANGWSPAVDGVLTVECGERYDMTLRTTRIP